MKRSIQTLCLAVLTLCGSTLAVDAADGVIAIIDMNRVFEEYDRTKAAKEKMEQQGAAFKAEVSEQIDSLKQLEEEFNLARQEAYDMALSEDVREKRKSEAEDKMISLRDREAEVKQLRDERKRELADASGRLIQSILDEIQVKVDKFSASRGFFLVMDSSGSTLNRLPAVVYHDGSTDITDEVLELLNVGADVTTVQDDAGE